MLVPVKFILDNVRGKQIEELRFYLSARYSGMNKAGYFKNIPGFTRLQERSLIKKLVKSGWIIKTANNYRIQSVVRIEDHPVHAVCDPGVLKSKEKFKGWILAVAESYIARNNHRINKGYKKDYDLRSKMYHRKQSVSGSSKFSDGSYGTEIANSFLSNLLGVSIRTISRWRKNSINQYKLTKKLADSQYAFEEGKCFFDKRTNKFAQWSLQVITEVFVYFSGEKHLQKSLSFPVFQECPS